MRGREREGGKRGRTEKERENQIQFVGIECVVEKIESEVNIPSLHCLMERITSAVLLLSPSPSPSLLLSLLHELSLHGSLSLSLFEYF